MEHLKAEDFKTTNWSGGTTTEFFIWPNGAEYKKGNFDFRLSTATVEVESSVFTPLEGVKRTLMVLSGEMTLKHEGQHTKKLGAFDQDQFNGGWTTHSEGTCVDFNLMCKGEITGALKHHSIDADSKLDLQSTAAKTLVYLYQGRATINGSTINAGDMVLFLKDVIVEKTITRTIITN